MKRRAMFQCFSQLYKNQKVNITIYDSTGNTELHNMIITISYWKTRDEIKLNVSEIFEKKISRVGNSTLKRPSSIFCISNISHLMIHKILKWRAALLESWWSPVLVLLLSPHPFPPSPHLIPFLPLYGLRRGERANSSSEQFISSISLDEYATGSPCISNLAKEGGLEGVWLV